MHEKTAGECLAISAISKAASETVTMASFSSQAVAVEPW
jgi:hypothetical protein